jgi:hypothetical protein
LGRFVAVALGFKNGEGEMSRKVVKMKESCVGDMGTDYIFGVDLEIWG